MKTIGLMVLVLSFSAVVEAQTNPEAADPCASFRGVEAADPVALEHDGTAGMWFPMPTARLMLCEIRELRIRKHELQLTTDELSLWKLQTGFVKEQLGLAVEARDSLEGVVEAADRRAREAEARLDDWTRSPVLWTAVGMVVAGLLFGGAIAALNSI